MLGPNSTLSTTAAIFVNEWQEALLEDFRTATKAYEFCRARIEQIQAELDTEMNRGRQPEPAIF